MRAFQTIPTLIAFVLSSFVASGFAVCQDKHSDTSSDLSAAVAKQIKLLYEAVEDNSALPIAKQQFVLNAARAIYSISNQTPPNDLASKVSAIVADDEYQRFLESCLNDVGAAQSNQPSEKILLAISNATLKELDSQFLFLSAKEMRVEKQLAENRYVGIGIQIAARRDFVEIVEPFPGGTARKAGAKQGDYIVEINGESMKGVQLPIVVDKLRGAEGTEVSVVLKNKHEKERRSYTITRAEIPIDSVTGIKRNDDDSWQFQLPGHSDIGYIKLTSIVGSTASELQKVARTVEPRNYKGMVIDLSQIRHADLHHATLVADVLLPSMEFCELATTTHKRAIKTSEEQLWPDIPIVVIAPSQPTDGPLFSLLQCLQVQENVAVCSKSNVLQSNGECRMTVELDDDQGAIKNLIYGYCLPDKEKFTASNSSLIESLKRKHAETPYVVGKNLKLTMEAEISASKPQEISTKSVKWIEDYLESSN